VSYDATHPLTPFEQNYKVYKRIMMEKDSKINK